MLDLVLDDENAEIMNSFQTSEDEIVRAHLRDSTLISTDATSDYYQLTASSSISSSSYLFCLLALVVLRLR